MKSLKPSMKENKRYFLVKGRVGEIENAVLEGIGVLGMSKVGLGWIKSGKDSAIVSVNREMVDSVRACFALFQEKISVEKVSGTLNGLRGKKRHQKT